MMQRAASVLGLTCLCCHTQGVFGRDGDGQEYFPLSGGIADGVKVTIKANKVENPGGMLDFLTPDREIAFRFNLDIAGSRVIRNSPASGGEEESFGGWGLNVGSPIEFEFTKTKFYWEVSIGGARFPWFDFMHRDQGALMTHVSVHSGFDDVEVILERPTCNMPCDPTECMTSQGASVCTGVNDTCYSTKPADGTYAAECSTSQETGDEGYHCCDGLPKSIGMSADNGTWVNIFADAAYVIRTGEAFGGEVKNLGTHAGTKALIRSYNAAQRTYEVWVPTATTERLRDSSFEYPSSTIYNYPAFALQASTGNGRTYVDIADGRTIWKDTENFAVDTHNGLVYKVNALASAAGLRVGMFINLIAYVLTGERRWFEYSRYADSTIRRLLNRDNTAVQVLAFYEELDKISECVDRGNFTDSNDNGCGDYASNPPWCNRHAEPSPEWCETNTVFGNCLLENSRDADTGLHAGWECCQCGGGTHTPPEEANAATVLLFK